MTRDPEKCRLLHGPYRPPRLHVGARADCQLRGTVVITSWTDAKISWPRCQPVNSKGHPSLLLDDELARTVRTEAAAAVWYWWGVSHGVVQRWRRALSVTRMNNPGTHKLVKESAQAGAEAIKAKEWSDAERDAARERARRLNLAQYMPAGFHGKWWGKDEKALPGQLPDQEVGRRVGRTPNAVRIKREQMGLPNPESTTWTADELSHLGTATDATVAQRIGRTPSAVAQKRLALGISAARRTTGAGKHQRGATA